MAEDDQPELEEKETQSDDQTSGAIVAESLTQKDTQTIIELEDIESDFEPQESNSVNETIAVTVRQPDYYGVL